MVRVVLRQKGVTKFPTQRGHPPGADVVLVHPLAAAAVHKGSGEGGEQEAGAGLPAPGAAPGVAQAGQTAPAPERRGFTRSPAACWHVRHTPKGFARRHITREEFAAQAGLRSPRIVEAIGQICRSLRRCLVVTLSGQNARVRMQKPCTALALPSLSPTTTRLYFALPRGPPLFRKTKVIKEGAFSVRSCHLPSPPHHPFGPCGRPTWLHRAEALSCLPSATAQLPFSEPVARIAQQTGRRQSSFAVPFHNAATAVNCSSLGLVLPNLLLKTR